jgi:predicted HTH transcriptional regulator
MPQGPYEKSLMELANCLANERLFKKNESYTLNEIREKCGKHLRTIESYINNHENLELLNKKLSELTGVLKESGLRRS